MAKFAVVEYVLRGTAEDDLAGIEIATRMNGSFDHNAGARFRVRLPMAR